MSKDKNKTEAGQVDGGNEDEDAAAFRRAMADARPLNKPVLEPQRKRIPARARFTRADERAVIGEILQSPSDEVESGSGDYLSYYQTSVGGRTFRRLARGKYSVQAECDLHGLNVADARETLQGFIEDCLRRGHTCVRVVHGKGRGSGHGGPVLKRKVDGWLRQWDKVLAFVSARQADGGTGAVYVLLKRL